MTDPLPRMSEPITNARDIVTLAIAGQFDAAMLLAVQNPPNGENMMRSIGHLLSIVQALINMHAASIGITPEELWRICCAQAEKAEGERKAD